MSTLAITYRKNPQYSKGASDAPRLFAEIDLGRYGVAARVTDLPIYFRQLEKPVGPIREVYSTRVAGLPLEKGNLEGLVTVLDRHLGVLIRFERLPEYVFHVGDSAWPIYRLYGQLVTRYPGGPVFSAPNIAELYASLADHFKQSGRIQNHRELGILYFSQTDLQLHPPGCTLHSPEAADIPVFSTKNGRGKQLLAPVESRSFIVPMNEGAGIFDLHRKVGAYLVKRGQIMDLYDVTVRKLAAPIWARVQATLNPYGRALSYCTESEGLLSNQQVPVFTNGRSLIAARANRRGRTSLYLGPDIWALQLQLGAELCQRGIVNSLDAVRIVSAGGATGKIGMEYGAA